MMYIDLKKCEMLYSLDMRILRRVMMGHLDYYDSVWILEPYNISAHACYKNFDKFFNRFDDKGNLI